MQANFLHLGTGRSREGRWRRPLDLRQSHDHVSLLAPGPLLVELVDVAVDALQFIGKGGDRLRAHLGRALEVDVAALLLPRRHDDGRRAIRS